MEEVWKGIEVSSLNHHHPPSTSTTATSPNIHGLNLHDFLARPSSKDPPTRVDSHETFSAGCSGATALSLSSGSEFRYLESSDRTRSQPQLQSHANGGTPSFISSWTSPFESLASTAVFTSFSKKRASDNSNDRRHRRMIKNRESAVRSRSRKQAYANQLEDEVARLLAENAKLRTQIQKFRSAAPSQSPQEQTLRRAITALF